MYEYEKALLKNKLGSYYDRLRKHKCFLAGGAITSVFTHTEINDYDIYFHSQQDVYNFMTESGSGMWLVSESDKSFTLKFCDNVVQAIFFRYFNEASEIFDSFDFTVCMGAYDFEKEEFVFHEDFMKDNVSRRLVFNNKTAFPIISALRIAKYKDKGYSIDRRQYMRVMLAVSRLKINSVDALKRHLGGMYGEELDSYLKLDENEPFDLEKVIERLGDYLAETNNVFCELDFYEGDYNIHIAKKLGMKIKYIQIDNRYYMRNGDYGFMRIYPENIDDSYCLDNTFIVNEFPMVKYKCVKKIGEGLYESYYDKNFIYELGRIAVAENQYNGLYCVDESGIKGCQYSDKSNAVMLKLLVMDARDIIPSKMGAAKKGIVQVTKAYVLEEMPVVV